jgi:hypothetical protein
VFQTVCFVPPAVKANFAHNTRIKQSKNQTIMESIMEMQQGIVGTSAFTVEWRAFMLSRKSDN